MTRQELREDLESIVRKVMREELREILTEAVEIASRPNNATVVEHHSHLNLPVPDWVAQMQEAHANTQQVAESKNPEMENSNAIMGLLGSTAKGMTGADFSNYR